MGMFSWLSIGCLTFLLCCAAITALAQTFTSLASFNWTNGANPDLVSLAQGVDGNLYGTTRYGGNSYGNGTIFRASTTGAITVVTILNGYRSFPFGGLVLGTGGNLYGTTSEGGPGGWGSVFEVTPAGTVQGLTSFNSQDGAYPTGTLIQASNGMLYGTTQNDGPN